MIFNISFGGNPEHLKKAAATVGTAATAAIASNGGIGATIAAIGTHAAAATGVVLASPALPFVVAGAAVGGTAMYLLDKEKKKKQKS
jgi:hypothetical protein